MSFDDLLKGSVQQAQQVQQNQVQWQGQNQWGSTYNNQGQWGQHQHLQFGSPA